MRPLDEHSQQHATICPAVWPFSRFPPSFQQVLLLGSWDNGASVCALVTGPQYGQLHRHLMTVVCINWQCFKWATIVVLYTVLFWAGTVYLRLYQTCPLPAYSLTTFCPQIDILCHCWQAGSSSPIIDHSVGLDMVMDDHCAGFLALSKGHPLQCFMMSAYVIVLARLVPNFMNLSWPDLLGILFGTLGENFYWS